MKICVVCTKQYKGHGLSKYCSKDCIKVVTKEYKHKHHLRTYIKKPIKRLTEEEKKQKQKAYRANPERKQFMYDYRRRPENLIKERESSRKYSKKSPHVEKNGHLKRVFGITLETYNKMLKNQNYNCDICKEKETRVVKNTGKIMDLCVDHCHITGKIRGLLCWNCNTSIGKFKDDVKKLQNAINYLMKHKG